MLTVQHLSKKYGKNLVNDDITFTISPGQIYVMAGPNGAGKSTCIKSIVGLLRFAGTILVDGHPNKSLEAKQVLGYVPELPAMYNMLTVEEHLQFIARAYRLGEGWEQRVETLLTRFELLDKRDKLGKELSQGMQQEVALACALLIEPKVLLLDEPMVGLDPHAIKELKAILLELRAAGCAILVSTHMLESMENLWDSVLILVKGRIAREMTRAQAGAMDEKLEDLFFRITENGGQSA